MFTVVLNVFTMKYLKEKNIGNICNIDVHVHIHIIVKAKYDGTYNIRNNANL